MIFELTQLEISKIKKFETELLKNKKEIKMNYYFTSDQHFSHDKIIEYCNRPFKNTTEMNETIIKRYNSIVNDTDICFFIGDIGLGKRDELKLIIDSLKGIKILVLGNHDRYSTKFYYDCGFSVVCKNITIPKGKHGDKLFLTHIPARSYYQFFKLCLTYIKTMRKKKRSIKQIFNRLNRELKNYTKLDKHYTICGHVHEKWKTKDTNINIGVDQWNFKPVEWNQIIDLINKNEK